MLLRERRTCQRCVAPQAQRPRPAPSVSAAEAHREPSRARSGQYQHGISPALQSRSPRSKTISNGVTVWHPKPGSAERMLASIRPSVSRPTAPAQRGIRKHPAEPREASTLDVTQGAAHLAGASRLLGRQRSPAVSRRSRGTGWKR